MVVNNDTEVTVINGLQFPNICSTLIDKKVHLAEKIKLLEQVNKADYQYDQIIIDWICSTIEFVSNSEKYITLNSVDINQLLVLLNNKLKANVVPVSREVILNPNIFEVLTRFFPVSSAVIDCKSLLKTWHLLLQNDSWKENLSVKSNISSLGWYCEFFISREGDFEVEVILNIIENLLECYLCHIKSQYVSKKVFVLFCNQLLIKLMCLYGVEHEDKLEKIKSYIDKLFSFIICSREHLANLKTVLKSTSTSETPSKKRKLHDDATNASSEKKGKSSKDELYYDQFFNELNKAKSEVSHNLLKALPRMYENMITATRSSESSLTRLEEFFLLMKLSDCLKLGTDVTSMKILEELFDVVIRYGIYQNVEDNAIGNTFYNWMAAFVQKFIDGCNNEDVAFKQLTLKVMLKVLNINHLVIQPVLPQIWNMCLQCCKDESQELRNIKELFLCDLLITYENLHQLDHLLSSFSISEFQKNSEILYPKRFLKRFQKSVSGLLTGQVNGILDIYLEKLKVICSSIQDEKNENAIICAEHEAYLLFYMVLMNASVIPGNGYPKPELQLLIDKLKTIKVTAIELMGICRENQKSYLHLPVLIQHGINNVMSLLSVFSLVEDDDVELNSFDESNITGTDSIHCYLKVALCFDQLSKDAASLESIATIVSTYGDACSHVDDSAEPWNQQILSIRPENYNDALVKLFEQNLSAILAFNDKSIISCGVNLMWKGILHRCKPSDKDEEYPCMLLSLLSYNNKYFQTSLLSSIYHSLQQFMNNKQVDIDDLLKEGASLDIVTEVNNKFTCQDTSCADVPEIIHVTEVDLQCCLSILKVIREIPLAYLTEQNLFTLSVIVLGVWEKFSRSNYVDVNFSSLQIIGKVLEIYAAGNHLVCHLPLEYILKSNLQYCNQNEMTQDFANTAISLCSYGVMVMVKYIGKDYSITSNVCQQILGYLNGDNISIPITLMVEKIFASLWQMVRERTIKTRSEYSVYEVVSTLSESLLKIINCLGDKNSSEDDSWFSIFKSLCQITQHAQVRKGESSPLKNLEDKLVELCPTVIKSIKTLLDSETKSVENKIQHLHIIEFFYSSSNDFTLRFRKLFEEEEKDVISILIKNAEANPAIESYAQLISNIVLRVDENMLGNLLESLTDRLVSQLKKADKKSIMTVWNTLLTAKWEKEQRIILWEYLPKVIVTCVHMTKVVETMDDLRLLLRLLVSVVNIGKNSLMSQYVNIIYHVFVMLPGKVKEFKYSSFVDLFEEIYQLASQLLFHHQSAILTSLPSYINVINSVLQILISYTALEKVQSEDSQTCFERTARLYKEIGSHKVIISKYSSFIIARFIRTTLSSSFSASSKKILENGIYCIMDTCTETEFSFLNTTLEKADKEYFKVIKNNYEKHHKFTGKA